MFVPGKLINPSLLFESKAAAYPTGAPLRLLRELPRGEHMNDAPLGKAPAILGYIRLGWILLPGTNTLAYSDHRLVKVGLHYSDCRSKLVPFEEHKNIFYILKRL